MQRFYHFLRSIKLYEANEDDPSRRSVICVCVSVCTPSCLSLGYTWIFPKFSSCITGIFLGISGMVTDPDHSFPFAAGVQGGWPWPPGKLAVSTGGCNCRGGRTHAQGQEIQETAGRLVIFLPMVAIWRFRKHEKRGDFTNMAGFRVFFLDKIEMYY